MTSPRTFAGEKRVQVFLRDPDVDPVERLRDEWESKVGHRSRAGELGKTGQSRSVLRVEVEIVLVL